MATIWTSDCYNAPMPAAPPAPRFIATTQHITFGPGTYLRVVPDYAVDRPRHSHRPDHERVSAFAAERPPHMPAGSEIVINGKPAAIVWAEGSQATVDVDGKHWLMSHMTPSEMALHRDAYEPGSLVQEWIVRERDEAHSTGS